MLSSATITNLKHTGNPNYRTIVQSGLQDCEPDLFFHHVTYFIINIKSYIEQSVPTKENVNGNRYKIWSKSRATLRGAVKMSILWLLQYCDN